MLDEPFSHLDFKIKMELIEEFKRLQRRLGVTTIYVTHDQNDAMLLADRIAVMKDGRVRQVGAPHEVYKRPSLPFVASFFGDANFIEGYLEGGRLRVNGREISVGDLGVSGKVLVAVRPEDVEIFKEYADGGLTLEGEVEDVAFLGPLVKVIVKTRSGRLKVVLPSRLADGNVSGKVYVSIRREKLMIFSADKA